MATPAQRTNTWILDQWYDQAVAGTQGDYVGGRSLFSVGTNIYSTLGLNQSSPSLKISSPTQVGTNINWQRVVQANNVALATKDDGTLWSWGRNTDGELGHNNKTQYSSPRQVGTDTTWSKVSRNSNNSGAITTDGELYMWGQNYGNLGLNQPGNGGPGGKTARSSPTQIPGDTWGHIENTGTGSNFGVKTDGTLWSWGYNTDGQLATNNKTRFSSPTQVGTDTDWNYNNDTNNWGGAAGNMVCTVKTDGSLWGWGNNNAGELGQNSRIKQSSPVQIPGSWKSVGNGGITGGGIKTDGTLWTWGNGGMGQLANGSTGNPNRRSSPVQVGTATDWSYMANCQDSNMGAFKTDGTLYTWGRNSEGELGQNNSSYRPDATQVPGVYSGNSVVAECSLFLKEV